MLIGRKIHELYNIDIKLERNKIKISAGTKKILRLEYRR
jgi:hypothetical protein